MTIDEILDGVLEREGEGTPPYADPHDRGGRTRWGISERANPDAWMHGPPSREMARSIYTRRYVSPFESLRAVGVDERVRVALIDDAVLSGPKTAIKALQRVLGVTVDGVIGPETVSAVLKENGAGQWLLTRLVQDRAHRLARIVERDPSQAVYIVGWIDRALGHLG